jgi:hypothetical protein
VQVIPWWGVAVPGGLLLIFVIVARFSVRTMRKNLDSRYHSIRRGSEEVTIFLNLGQKAKNPAGAGANSGRAEPGIGPGALWDPVPITMPTYVSKPLAPRTVRTIDLSGPAAVSSASPELPVTADAQPVADAGSEEQPAELGAVDIERAATA